MKVVLIVGLLMAAPFAHANKFTDWCARHLVAENPYPFAEYPTAHLMELLPHSRDGAVLKELVFRLRVGMMTPDEVNTFWNTVEIREVDND